MNLQTLAGIVSEWLGVIAVIMLIGLSKRFQQRRPLAFVYPRREGVLSLYLYSFILLLAVFFFTSTFTTRPIIENIFKNSLSAHLGLAIISLIPFLGALWVRRQPLRSAGWPVAMLNPSLRLSLALVFLSVFLRGAIYRLLDGISQGELLTLTIWIGIALCEETIFRGYLHPRFSSWLGKTQGWLLTAFLFTLWSFPRFLYAPHPLVDSIPLSLGITLLMGLLLGWMVQRTGHVGAPIFYRAVSEWISYLA